jgi:hypothetical protein
VACFDGGKVEPNTHRCQDKGTRVNFDNCSISEDKYHGLI